MTDAEINDGKTLAVVSYLTFVGTIIAIIFNLEKKNRFTWFHVRQMLGLIILLIFSNLVEKYVNSLLGTVFWAVTFVCWLFGLFTAIRGESKPIPYLGPMFQKWFKNLN